MTDTKSGHRPTAFEHMPFAEAQRRVDPEEKKMVARWVTNEIQLTNGSGVFLDAGSQCLAVYEEVRDLIKQNRLANLTMVTNSFLILDSWRSDYLIPQLQGTAVEMAGEIFDAPHLALYGNALRDRLLCGRFKPRVVYIGTSGIDFDEDRVHLGYHAADLEAAAKMLLFQCPATVRVILATPQKIGNPGGRLFDILSVPKLDPRAPIYIVTTAPDGDEESSQFSKAQEAFKGKRLREALIRKRLTMHWITLERSAKGIPKAIQHIVEPNDNESKPAFVESHSSTPADAQNSDQPTAPSLLQT